MLDFRLAYMLLGKETTHAMIREMIDRMGLASYVLLVVFGDVVFPPIGLIGVMIHVPQYLSRMRS